jgi:hypothetical protein
MELPTGERRQGIRVLGMRWSPKCYELRDFLARNRVPYEFNERRNLVRDQGVGDSNPLSPTLQTLEQRFWFSVYIDGVDFVDGACIADFL